MNSPLQTRLVNPCMVLMVILSFMCSSYPTDAWRLVEWPKPFPNDPAFKAMDEFGRGTSVLFVNGSIRLFECPYAEVSEIEGGKLHGTTFSIPDEWFYDLGEVFDVLCPDSNTIDEGVLDSDVILDPPTGFVRRLVSASDKCSVGGLQCGRALKRAPYKIPSVCAPPGNAPGITECNWYKHGTKNKDWYYFTNSANCGSEINIKYSKGEEGQQNILLPGILILIDVDLDVIMLHIQGPYTLYCSTRRPGDHVGYYANITNMHDLYYRINVDKEPFKRDGILRVDCKIWSIPAREDFIHLFLGDGQVGIACKDGSVSCSVPQLFSRHNVPATPKDKDGGVVCEAELKLCYPTEVATTVQSHVIQCEKPTVPETEAPAITGSEKGTAGPDKAGPEKSSSMSIIMGGLLLLCTVAFAV